MRCRFDRVVVFSPDTTTGGPEALHQLVDSVNRQGGEAMLVYTGPQSKFFIKDGVIECSFDSNSIAFKTYRRYHPVTFSSFEVTKKSLLIFPEIYKDLAWTAHCCLPGAVACWWLAVHDLRAGRDKDWCDFFLKNVIHICQSHYAMQYLLGDGAEIVVPIFDYTDLNFVRRGLISIDGDAPAGRKPRTIAYFPRKGGDLASLFFDRVKDSGIVPVPIDNMSKNEVMETLGSTEIYVDFGHQPGKDRVPREAAAVGNVILLQRMGAGLHYLDHNLDGQYKFDRSDVGSGSLYNTIEAIFGDLASHLDRQRYYRQKVFLEKDEFDLQVRQFFFSEL
jgi:hypothetical protein